MERLSRSPYVLNVYANCGVSQIIEYGQASLHDLIKLARQQGHDSKFRLSPVAKMRIAYHLAAGIADLHEIDSSTMPSFAHNDIDPGQIILVDGIYKISDFHLSSMLYKDSTTGDVCLESPIELNSFVSNLYDCIGICFDDMRA